MLTTQNLAFDAKDVPCIWVYAHYCNLPLDIFDGSDFKIKSIFQSEKTASMSLYVNNKGTYNFNDFSSGNRGTHIDLVMLLFSLTCFEAMMKIVTDYNDYQSRYNVLIDSRSFTSNARYKVTTFEVRSWNVNDRDFWTPYNIGSSLLGRYCVKPFASYTMTKEDSELVITGDYLYGYFTMDGELYKIYQPKNPTHKFIKVSSHIQGSEQVKGHPTLIYTSSLKDIMSMTSMELNIDYKAPDSENTILSLEDVEMDKEVYTDIFTLFDNDEAGVKAANKYKELYNIEPLFINYGEKDPSDHIKKLGINRVRSIFVPLIDRKLRNNYSLSF